MPHIQGMNVQEGERVLVLIHNSGLFLSFDDLAEDAVFQALLLVHSGRLRAEKASVTHRAFLNNPQAHSRTREPFGVRIE